MAIPENELTIEEMCKNLRFNTQIFSLQEAFQAL